MKTFSKARENNYDLLRIWCCLAVILMHVSAVFINYQNDEGVFITDGYHVIVLLNNLTKYAVPCFVMIAGAFALSNPKNTNYKYYYRKIFVTVWLPMLIFTIIYIFVNTLFKTGGGYALGNIVKAFVSSCLDGLKGNPEYHMWYLYMMVPIYLSVPVITRWKESIKPKTYTLAAIAILLVSLLSNYTSSHTYEWALGRAMGYWGYFIMGDVIRNRFLQKKSNMMGVLLIFAALAIGVVRMFASPDNAFLELTKKYLSINVISVLDTISALLIFEGFSLLQLKCEKIRLAKHTFYAYMFHVLVLKILNIVVLKNYLHNLYSFPIAFIVVLVLSFVLAYVYDWLWCRVEEKWAFSDVICRRIGLG